MPHLINMSLTEEEAEAILECIALAAELYGMKTLTAIRTGKPEDYMKASKEKTDAWLLYDRLKNTIKHYKEV